MSYIGRGLDKISNIELLDAITFTDSAGPYNITKDSTAFVPTASNALVISIDGVVQDPSSYSTSVATITFDSVMAATSTMNFMYQIGVGVITTPSDDSVTTAKLANLSVTAAKLAADAVETAKIADLNVTAGKLAATQDLSTKTITLPASVSGLGTGITNAQLAGSIDVTTKITGIVPTANLGSGTASASTYLAGDQSYKTISEYNDDALQNDIATLALHQATNSNSVKYNLTNTNVDVYQDSSAITSLTNVSRNTTGEYVSTYSTSTSRDYDQTLSTTRANMTITTGGWTGAITNDAIERPAGSGGNYPSFYVNYIYDLAEDWKIKLFIVDRSSGAQASETYATWNCLITTDTSIAPGADTATSSADGRVFRETDFSADTGSAMYRIETGAEWADDFIIASYGTTIGVDSATAHNVDASFGHQQIDCSGLTSPFINSAYGAASPSIYGWLVEYDQSANTITIRQPTNAAFSTFSSNYTTFSNVPATGRFLMVPGSGGASVSNAYSTTYASVAEADKGYADVTTVSVPATGSYESTAQTANASTTVVSAVLTYTNASGTATLNTDLVCEVSADNGSTWQTATLTAAGTFSTGILQAVANDVTCAAGTQIKYKISFANQADGVKVTRVNGVSLIY